MIRYGPYLKRGTFWCIRLFADGNPFEFRGKAVTNHASLVRAGGYDDHPRHGQRGERRTDRVQDDEGTTDGRDPRSTQEGSRSKAGTEEVKAGTNMASSFPTSRLGRIPSQKGSMLTSLSGGDKTLPPAKAETHGR